jgi:ketol-acid reductoisomerase
MANYFNSLPLRLQLEQLGVCEFMDQSEFADGIKALKGKSSYCWLWSPRFESRMNMRDSGLDISYALRAEAISQSFFYKRC